MNKKTNFRRQFFANNMHREMFALVFVAACVPALLATIAVFHLIFNITAESVGIPESIAYTILPAAKKVAVILLIAMPIVLAVILYYARMLTHEIIGPFDRIVRELRENLDGKRQGHIVLRGKDKFQPLVDEINELIDRVN